MPTTRQEQAWVGKDAPDFCLSSTMGDKVQLSHFKGKKVWVSFFRAATCPLCNIRIHEMIESHNTLIEPYGMVVLAIFESPLDAMTQYAGAHPCPFPILSDAGGASHKSYACELSTSGVYRGACLAVCAGQMKLSSLLRGRRSSKVAPAGEVAPFNRMPADFLIGEDGKVRDAFYAKTVNKHIGWDRITEFLGISAFDEDDV